MELQEREVDMCFVGQIPNPTHAIAILRNLFQNQFRSLAIKGGESQMSRRSTPAPQRRKFLTKSLSVGDSLGSKFGLEWSFGVIIHARVMLTIMLIVCEVCRLVADFRLQTRRRRG